MYKLSEHKSINGTTAVMYRLTAEDHHIKCTNCQDDFQPSQVVTAHYINGNHQGTLCWTCEQKRLFFPQAHTLNQMVPNNT